MTHHATITFTAQGMGTVTVRDALQALQPAGWSLLQTGKTAFQDHTGTPSWQPSQQRDPAALIAALDDPNHRHQWVGITIHHHTGNAGRLLFHPGREQLTFTLTTQRRPHDAHEQLTDLPWYLESMLPGFFGIGLTGYKMEDHLTTQPTPAG